MLARLPKTLGSNRIIVTKSGKDQTAVLRLKEFLCKVKGDAERVQNFEASLVEPEFPTHITSIDRRKLGVNRR